MLADFGVLKDALRKIVGALDHTNLNDNAVFMNDPSAERIARYIFQELYGVLPSYDVDAELLSAVDVYETPVNMARYEKDPVETAATETIPHFND
jgi:6-pyruvoyltetrahydropterin/6-carboxytetrahydropterin synthase